MFYQQKGSATQQMIYIETKDELVTPAEHQEGIEELDKESDANEDAESTHPEGQPEDQDDVFKEPYWRRLGRPLPREIKGLRTHNNPGLLDRSDRTAHFCFIVNNLKKQC